ncbi:MAG: two-component regulator propeller domain-containing protein [Candidatus Latescibacterota bacterium]
MTVPSAAEGPSPDPVPTFDHALWRHYTVFDGLAGMRVEWLHQDRQGFVWTATADGGVSRFDGVHFDNLTVAHGLPHTTVMGIAETDDGRLWFATMGGGVAVWDGTRFEVHRVSQGLPSDQVLGVRRFPDGSVWAMTRAGVGIFAQGTCCRQITRVGDQPLTDVYDAVTDGAGRTWFASWEQGLVRQDGYRPAPVATACSLAADADGCLWVATLFTGRQEPLYRYDPWADELTTVPVSGEAGALFRHGIGRLRVERRGWLWVALRGVAYFDGAEWHQVPLPRQTVSLSGAHCTYEDREGNLWVGFWGGGLLFCGPLSIQHFTAADELPDTEVTSLAADGCGRIWVGTRGGLALLEGERLRSLSPEEGYPEGMVFSLLPGSDGRMWASADQGRIYRCGEDGASVLQVADGEGEVTVLHEGRQGRVWVGTYAGVAGWLQDGRFRRVDRGRARWVRALYEDPRGRLWIGTHGMDVDLHVLCGDCLEEVTSAPLEHYVYAFCEAPDGTLWVGTGGGLLCCRDGEWRRFGTEDGLVENAVLALALDDHGQVWLGTSGGEPCTSTGRPSTSFAWATCPATTSLRRCCRRPAGRCGSGRAGACCATARGGCRRGWPSARWWPGRCTPTRAA